MKKKVTSWPASKVELRPIDSLIPYENNPRTHPPEQIAILAESMKNDGVTAPIMVDESNVIIYGHGRRLAAIENGFKNYPVIVARGWTEEQKRAARLKDNQIGLMSGWDAALIHGEIIDLKAAGYDIAMLGFPEVQLRAWDVSGGTDGVEVEQIPERPKKPIVRRGDLWVLGDHRLMCGDSTSQADVQSALDGALPNLMVTDPPYGVNYDPKWRDDLGLDWMGQAQRRSTHPNTKPLKSRSLGKVSNDHEADWTAAWKLFAGDIAYVWHGGLHAGTVQANLVGAGFAVRAQIIWVKQHFVFSRGDYHWQHEPCWYAVRKKGNWTGDRKQTTVWQIANASAFHGSKDDAVTGHGTQKPIECMKRPIENNSRKGDAIYEPFSGSGTTIIACEMTGRHCRAIEIDPGYVEVTIERWQKFTGRQATLDGQPFEAVAKARRTGRAKGANGDAAGNSRKPVSRKNARGNGRQQAVRPALHARRVKSRRKPAGEPSAVAGNS